MQQERIKARFRPGGMRHEKICPVCNSSFFVPPSYLITKNPTYCSRNCYTQQRQSYASNNILQRSKLLTLPWPIIKLIRKGRSGVVAVILACVLCGKRRTLSVSTVIANEYHNLCRVCSSKKYRRGTANSSWKRGYSINADGYKLITIYEEDPYFALAQHTGRVFEHRYIMAKHLSRLLTKKETVHHKDGNKLNNSIENLELRTIDNHGPGHEADIYQQKFTAYYHKIKQLEDRIKTLEVVQTRQAFFITFLLGQRIKDKGKK